MTAERCNAKSKIAGLVNRSGITAQRLYNWRDRYEESVQV